MMTNGFQFDADYAAATRPLSKLSGERDPAEASTIQSLVDLQVDAWSACAAIAPQPGVSRTQYEAHRADGSLLGLRWYAPPGVYSGGAAVFLHGGGMIANDVDSYDAVVAQYVAYSGTPLLSVEYRLAPAHPFPAGLNDAVTAIRWLKHHHKKLGINPGRVGVMGDSGGGGIAAGAALYCRDIGVELALQILLYPMLDDRTRDADPVLQPFLEWTPEHNALAWDAVLGQAPADVSPYAAASRADDLSGLPRTYIDTGELDLFRAEILSYAARLTAAGVSTELHLHAGVPHAFEFIAPDIPVATRMFADRYRILSSLN